MSEFGSDEAGFARLSDAFDSVAATTPGQEQQYPSKAGGGVARRSGGVQSGRKGSHAPLLDLEDVLAVLDRWVYKFVRVGI